MKPHDKVVKMMSLADYIIIAMKKYILENLKKLAEWVWWAGKLILFIFWTLWILDFNISPNLVTDVPLHYENPSYCFGLDYPARWRIDSYGERGNRGDKYERTNLYSSSFARYVISVEQKTFNSPSISDVAQWSRDELFGNTPSNMTPVDEIVVNNQIAGSRIFTSARTESKWREVYIPRQADGLVLRLLTTKNNFEEGNRIFEEVLASFTYDDTCP